MTRAGGHKDGAVYIEMKDHAKALRLLDSKPMSLEQITLAYVTDFSKHKQPVIYVVDDKMLTDTANVRIPKMLLEQVKVVKSTETPYFKSALPNVLIISISTKTPVLTLRGMHEK